MGGSGDFSGTCPHSETLGCCSGTYFKLLYWGNPIIYYVYLLWYRKPLFQGHRADHRLESSGWDSALCAFQECTLLASMRPFLDGPNNKDHSISWSILGSPYLWKLPIEQYLQSDVQVLQLVPSDLQPRVTRSERAPRMVKKRQLNRIANSAAEDHTRPKKKA